MKNNSQNVNIKCNPGFYIQVGRPALCNLSVGYSDTLSGVTISCTSKIPKFDKKNVEVNYLLYFDLLVPDVLKPKRVTIHLHHSTRLIQIQGGSLMPDNTRVPVWFTKNVLQNIFHNLAQAKAVDISEFNNSLKTLSTSQSYPVAQNVCSLCQKHPNTEMTKCTECANSFHSVNCFEVHVSNEHGMSSPASQSILTPLVPLYSPPAVPGPSGNS